MDWLTLYTKANLENQVNAVLQAKGVETYLPVVLRHSTHSRRKEAVPFFPCYLFARMDPAWCEYVELPWTPGLRQVVRFEGRPAWLPNSVVVEIREHLARLEGLGYFEPGRQFQPGDHVRISAGPLHGLEAVFDRTLSRAGRVRVLLDFLGRLTSAEVSVDCLTKVG